MSATEAKDVGMPRAVAEAIERSSADLTMIMGWLREGERIDEHMVESVREWATYVVALTEGSGAPVRRSVEEIRAAARKRQIDRGPGVEPRLPGEPPAIEIDPIEGRVRLVFEMSADQFWALEAAGRERARERNVQVVGPAKYLGQPWSDELCARWAIQHAVSTVYPAEFTDPPSRVAKP